MRATKGVFFSFMFILFLLTMVIVNHKTSTTTLTISRGISTKSQWLFPEMGTVRNMLLTCTEKTLCKTAPHIA